MKCKMSLLELLRQLLLEAVHPRAVPGWQLCVERLQLAGVLQEPAHLSPGVCPRRREDERRPLVAPTGVRVVVVGPLDFVLFAHDDRDCTRDRGLVHPEAFVVLGARQIGSEHGLPVHLEHRGALPLSDERLLGVELVCRCEAAAQQVADHRGSVAPRSGVHPADEGPVIAPRARTTQRVLLRRGARIALEIEMHVVAERHDAGLGRSRQLRPELVLPQHQPIVGHDPRVDVSRLVLATLVGEVEQYNWLLRALLDGLLEVYQCHLLWIPGHYKTNGAISTPAEQLLHLTSITVNITDQHVADIPQ
mmetsp:Transcript_92453/g.247935  ORF Transcript_92453/g.247935 Transcript_92453/m.247935 type:complete len:306 (+) Transcript_92453:266-1183(+)